MFHHKSRSGDAAVRLIDLAALALALPLAFEVYRELFRPDALEVVSLDRYWLALVVVMLLWSAGAWIYQVYEAGPGSLSDDLRRVARALMAVALVMFTLVFLAKQQESVSRLLAVLYFALAFPILAVARAVHRAVARAAGTRNGRVRYYAVVGSGDVAEEIIETIRAHPEWGMRLAGYVLEEGAVAASPDCVILGRLGNLARILEDHVLDDVVFAVPRERLSAVEDAVRTCEEQGVGALISLDVLRFGYSRMAVGDMDGLPMLALSRTPSDQLALAAKRAFDLVVSASVLLLLSPLLLGVMVAIRLDSRGPIFFRQRRVGVHGRVFNILKFRSMYVDAEARLEALRAHNEMSGPVFKMKNDPRVTRIGRFIRRTSLDEFPQFWNVLRGEMSVVGPRPPLPSEVRQYKRWQRRRLSVKPGITCIWQISGRNDIDFDRWMELDLQYIDEWSLWNDVRICLKTIPAVLGARGAQ
ncbi:galactosyl transferase CpsE [Anaeromyxobacter sp. PSR-1]|nr:sugar transferase [Anaeromyxobacter sp. PSR-1]GAO03659.1 galactosyl transferase CpsE [Anaeromyxobacter sp. PSR-1]